MTYLFNICLQTAALLHIRLMQERFGSYILSRLLYHTLGM